MTSFACVAFQGGGALGMAHLGAWQELARRFGVVGAAGTSAGAIVAALCAASYTPTHAIDLFNDLQWPEFVQRQGLFELFRKQDGWSDGERFYQWLRGRMGAYLAGTPQLVNFASLYQLTGVYLAIVATDLNDKTGTPVVFDKDSEPHTDVTFAVRASISIPGVFSPVPRRDRGQTLVDGGLLLNFPGRLLLPLARSQGYPIIGVRFEQPQPQLESPKVWEVLKRSINIGLQAGSLVAAELAQYTHYIDVVINVADFNSLNFDLTPVQKQALIQRGVDAASRALLEYDLRIEREKTKAASSGSTTFDTRPDEPASRQQTHHSSGTPPSSGEQSAVEPTQPSVPGEYTKASSDATTPSVLAISSSMTGRLSNLRRTTLEKRLARLSQEYQAANNQFDNLLDDVQRERVKLTIADLERQIQAVEDELQQL